jgi:putative tricarboxylic transport membrane protein
MKHKTVRHILRLLAVAISLALPAAAHAQAWKPDHNIEIISTSGAGGLNDIVARTLQELWRSQNTLGVSTTVVNRPGGGGVIAMNYLKQHAGDPYYVANSSPDLLTNKILGTSQNTYSDFTPLAILFDEYIAVAVRADSPIKTAHDLIDRLKKDPQSLSFALSTSLGNQMHIGIAMPLKQEGVDIKKLKIAVFNSGAEVVANLLGGHVDAISTTPEDIAGQLQAGKVRVIAVSSPKRLPGTFAGVPTWKEQGIDFTFSVPYTSLGPPGLSAAEIAFWQGAFQRLAGMAAWKKRLQSNFWESDFRSPADTKKYLAGQYQQYKEILTDIGLAKN